MIPSLPTARTNWLELQSKLVSKYRESNVCVVGGMKVIGFHMKVLYQTILYHIS